MLEIQTIRLSIKNKNKNSNSTMTTNSQLLTTEPKKTPKNKLSKEREQEQNHINGDHMEGYQWRSEKGEIYRE